MFSFSYCKDLDDKRAQKNLMKVLKWDNKVTSHRDKLTNKLYVKSRLLSIFILIRVRNMMNEEEKYNCNTRRFSNNLRGQCY